MTNFRMITITFMVIIICLVFACGCSGNYSNDPISATPPDKVVADACNRYNWGLWQFVADPAAGTLEVVPLRNGNLHLNAMHVLEPPAYVNLNVEQVKFVGKTVECVVNLRHPFLGLVQYTGFDVCGILITNGSLSGFSDPDLVMAGEGETRLLNPDGYTRWWNPAEFPINPGTMLGYQDGMLGVPDSVADYNCTLNAYKYFADELGPDDALDILSIEGRGMFSAGQKNSRRYIIEIGGDELVFNYAVDASWKFPTGQVPWSAPEDFGPNANRPEAWRIVVHEIENTLYNDGEASGGGLKLDVDVYDWFKADMNTVRIESPDNFAMVESADVVGDGEGFSTYEVDINNATPAPDEISLLISVVSENENFGGFIPGVNTTAYFTCTIPVSGGTPLQYHWELDAGGLVYDLSLFDDMSPALAWETDDQLRCYWTSDSTPGHPWNPCGQDQAVRSDDGGQTWIDYHQYWGHGNDGCMDHAKIIAADNGNSFALHPLAKPGGVESPPHYYAGASTNWDMGFSWAFTMLPYCDCGELICAGDGYLHVFGDKKDWVPQSGIYQQVCNQTYTFFNDWSWWPDPDPDKIPWPSMWWPLDIHLVADQPAHLSNTRSIGDDSSGTIYLAYWGGTEGDFIKIARSTDGSTGLNWDNLTIFDASGYSNVRDPGLDVDANDRIHLSFLRHNDSTDEDEVCYTYSSDGGDSWSPIQVVYTSDSLLTDTPVVAYEALGAYVVAITYEEADGVYFVSSFDAGQNWEMPIPVSYGGGSSDKMPDMVEGTDNKLHFAFSHLGANDREIHFRNATLVKD